MTDQVESLDVGFQDGVSAGAKKATDAVTGLGDAFTATEAKAARAGRGAKKATDEVAAGAAAAGKAIDAYAGTVERADQRVKRHAQTADQLANKFDRAKREAAAVARAIAPYQRALDDLEASSASAAQKEELRATITAKMEAATEKARAAVARYFKDVEAGAAAATAAAGGLSAGMAAATASAGSWAGALGKVYEAAGSATGGLAQAARALQALNADFQSGHASMAEWAAGSKGLEASLRGVSAAQKAINDATGISRQSANTAVVGPTRYATTGRGSSGTGSITFGDDGSAQRLDDITAAFAEADAKLDSYRTSLGLTDVAQQKYEVGLAELQATIRRAGVDEAEATRLLTAYAAAHDPAIKKAKELAAAQATAAKEVEQAERAALAKMSADWDAAVREREADAAMIIAAEKEAAAAVKQEEAALRSLVGTLDRTFGAEEKLAASQRQLDKALTDGVGGIRLTTEQHAALSAKLKEQHELSTRAATSTKLAAHESLNLGYQIQDFVVQVGSGQSALTAMLQQGPQAVGAVGGMSRAWALLTSTTALTTLGIGAFVGALAMVGARAAQIGAHTRQMTADIQAMGNASGVTATQLRRIEAQLRQQGVGGAAAFASARTLAGARNLPSSVLGDVASIGRDMAASTGDVADAVKTLSDALSEGYQGIRKLDDQFNFLTTDERRQIDTMARHGDQAGVLKVAVAALHRQFDGLHEKSLSSVDAAFERVTAAYNRLLDAIASRPIVIKGLEGLAWLLETSTKGIGAPTRLEQIGSLRRELSGLDAQYAALPEKTTGVQSAHEAIILRRIDLMQQLAKLEQEDAARQASQIRTGAPRTAGTSNARTGMPDPAAAKYVDEQAAAFERLSEAMQGNAVQRALAQADMRADEDIRDRRLRGAAADEVRTIRQKEALLQLQVAVNDNNRAAAAEAAGADLVARAYGQSTAAVREAEIQAKALAEVARGSIEPYDAIVGRLRALDDAQRKVQAAQFDATLKQQTEDAQRLAAAWGQGANAAREAALANEALAEARKRGLDPNRDAGQIRDISAGILARDAAQRSQQFAQMAAEQHRAVDLANAEFGMLGESNAERARSVAIIQATNDLRDKGVDLTDAGTQAYIRQQGELARVNSQLQDAAQNAANMAQPITSAFEDVIVGAKKAGDAGKAMAEDLKRVFARVLITKPAETWLTGTLTKMMSGPISTANDNTPAPANDPGSLSRIVTSVNGGLGSSSSNPMWVQMAGSAAAVALDPQAMAGGAPLPVAIKDGGQVADLIRSEARAQGVPEEVALAIGKIESGFRQYRDDGRVLTSSAGAQGVMQLMPGTAKWLGVDATDTRENVRGGIKYLAMLGRQFGGDWTMAAAAYNAGPTRVQQYLTQGRALPAETVPYIEKFGKSVQTANAAVATMGTRTSGVTQAQEDALQAQLDAANASKVAAGSAQSLNASQSALVASVLGTASANDNAAATIEVQSRAISHIGENAISAADHLDDAADGAKALAKASDSAGDTLLAGAQSVYNGFSSAISGIWNWVAGLFSSGSGGGATSVGAARAAGSSGVSTSDLLSLGKSGYQILQGGAGASWANAATGFAQSSFGAALGLSTSGQAAAVAAGAQSATAAGVMGVPGGLTAGTPVLTSSGAGFASAAGTIGAAMPYGILGGIGGSYIANKWLGGSKAGGALAGAALGAGSAGLGASILGMGAVGGPWGIVAAAAISAIMAALGTQKPTVGPTASADITINTGGKSATSGNYLTDNDGDPAAAQQLGSAFSAIFTAAASGGGTLAKNFGIGQTAAKGLYVAGSVPYKEFGKGDDALGNLLRYTLLEQGGLTNAGPNVTKAIQNTKATSYEEAAKDIGLGASIDGGITALSELDKSLAGITRSAKEATTESLKPMLEEFERAKKLGIGDAYKALASGQLKEQLEQLKNPVDWTQGEQDMAALTGQFQALRDAAMQLDPALATTVDQIETETRARVKQRAETDAKRLLNTASGHDFLNQITDLESTRDINARNLAAAGADISVAGDIFNAALTSLLTDLDASELDLVTKTFGGDIGVLAQTLKTTGKAAVEAAANLRAYNADLQSRMYGAVGNARGSGLLALDQQQSVEMTQAKAAGYDTSLLALVQGAERGQKAFELAQADVLGWYDQEITARQTFISDLQEGAIKVSQAAKQFAAARDALAISQDAPISPQERLTETKRQWDAALATVRSTTASDEDKDTARSNLISLGQTLTSIEKENSGGTARTIYDEVMQVLGELGTIAPDSAAATADAQLKTAQDSLKELQKARAEAAAVGQRQLGSLDTLKDTMGQSLAVWQAALGPLQQMTGTASTAPHYSAPAVVQSAWNGLSSEQQFGIARAMGWGGSVDEAFNLWLAADKSRAATFEGNVTAIGGGARYAAPDDVGRAWEALTQAQQSAAVKAAGYDGGVDAGLNAWVRLGHAAAFEAAVRSAAHGAGIPGFATGTLSTPPGAVWVGERGPELLWQGGGAAVASSVDSMRIAGMYQTAANDRYPVNVAPIRPPAGPVAADNREVVAVLRDIARRIERLEAAIHEAEGEAQTQRSRIARDKLKVMQQQLTALVEQKEMRFA